jgi:hypothetical protein
MKTRILSLLAVAVITVASMSSCSKYEDGPGFSMRSKKARLTGEWKVTEYKYQGETQDLDGEEVKFEYEKDGSLTETYTSEGETGVEKGKWDFSNDKETLFVTYDGESNSDNYTIVRLTNKELWMFSEYTQDNTTYKLEVKLEKQ